MPIDESNVDRMHAMVMDPDEMWKICLEIGKELHEQVLRARERCKQAGDLQNGEEATEFLYRAKRFYAHSRLMKMFKSLCEQIDEQMGLSEIPDDSRKDSSDMN